MKEEKIYEVEKGQAFDIINKKIFEEFNVTIKILDTTNDLLYHIDIEEFNKRFDISFWMWDSINYPHNITKSLTLKDVNLQDINLYINNILYMICNCDYIS